MPSKVPPPPEDWTPKTKLGKMVVEGRITSMLDVILNGFVVQESEVVKLLLPDLEYEVLEIRLVQKQTDAGEKSRFRAVVVVGNRNGWVGVGSSKARQVHRAIEKALNKALLNITPVRRGCGSWECTCNTPHSLAVATEGKSGSVRVKILPGPKGLGIVAGDTAKTILELAGVSDCWVVAKGETRTILSYAQAVYEALKNTYKVQTKDVW
ncbi:30S ribosomal protein S5 [Candidatus Geothermarchaeota archaeon]|nr:MAG: 30S ribosomal protein S5 [Candidatus Geothermarchaeota archaeon]